MRNPGRRYEGFTVVELMVVLAIIMILAGLLLTTAWGARQKALQTYCLNNIRQLAVSEIGGGLGQAGACPAGCTYARNAYIHDLRSINDTSRTVLYFESDGVSSGTAVDVVKWHLGGANYAFCDGHAKWSVETPSFRP